MGPPASDDAASGPLPNSQKTYIRILYSDVFSQMAPEEEDDINDSPYLFVGPDAVPHRHAQVLPVASPIGSEFG